MDTKRHVRMDEEATAVAKNLPEKGDPRWNAPPYAPPTTARPDEEPSIKSVELECPYGQGARDLDTQSELLRYRIQRSFRPHVVSCSP